MLSIIFCGSLIMFVIQIILLVIVGRKNDNKKLNYLIAFSVIMLILFKINYYHFTSIDLTGDIFSGLTLLGIEVRCIGLISIETIILFTNLIVKIVKYENKQKKLNKKYKNPLFLIIAMLLLFVGTGYFILEKEKNYGVFETKIKILEVLNCDRDNYCDTKMEFELNGKKYIGEINIDKKYITQGDIKLNLKYDKIIKKYDMVYKEDYRYIYIPLFIPSFIMLFIRFKNKLIKKKGENDGK